MNTEIKNKVLEGERFFDNFVTSSKDWMFQDSKEPTFVNYNGNVHMHGNDIVDIGIAAKRKGDYLTAIDACLTLLTAGYQQFGYASANLARSYYKVLICANEFEAAFHLIMNLAGCLQDAVDEGQEINPMTTMLIEGDFQSMIDMTLEVVDNNDFSNVQPYCANYSGSPLYRMCKTRNDILQSFSNIRNELRTVGI